MNEAIPPENNKHYKNISASKIQPAKTEIKSISINKDFCEASYNAWMTGNLPFLEDYHKGQIAGGFAKKNLTIDEIFDNIYQGLKESIINSYQKRNTSIKDLEEQFKILKSVLKIIGSQLKEGQGKTEEIIGFFQGFLNSTVAHLQDQNETYETRS